MPTKPSLHFPSRCNCRLKPTNIARHSLKWYMAAVALLAAGFRVACYNPRSRGGNELQNAFLYSAGYTEDLRRIVAHIQRAFPAATLAAAGFSLGASYLSKFVAEEGERCALAGAAASELCSILYAVSTFDAVGHSDAAAAAGRCCCSTRAAIRPDRRLQTSHPAGSAYVSDGRRRKPPLRTPDIAKRVEPSEGPRAIPHKSSLLLWLERS